MAIKIVWSPQAVEDLHDTADYIARDSEIYAHAVVSKVVETAEDLALFPSRGRIVPELGNDHIKECFIYSYRLIYRVDEERVLIIALVHGKRLLENIPDRFEENE